MKMKKIILFLTCFLLCGCSIEYNVTIENNSILEEVIITESINNRNNKAVSGSSSTIYETLKNEYKYYQPLDYENQMEIQEGEKIEGVSYYNQTWLEKNGNFGIEYKGYQTTNTYSKSMAVNSCFDSFNANFVNGNYVIATTKGFKCYDDYRLLSDVKITLKTSQDVIYNNADQVSGNTYTWHITKNNAKSKSINITLKQKQTISEPTTPNNSNNIKNNENIKFSDIIIYIVIGVFIIFVIGAIIYNRKQEKKKYE